MPLEYTRHPNAATALNLPRNLGQLLLRLVTAGSLLLWHAGPQALSAWSHLWYKTPWDLPRELAQRGFPVALPLGVSLVILCVTGALFMVLGLLTRLCAFLIGTLCLITGFLYLAYPATAEPALLYAGACYSICLMGQGIFALDRLLRATVGRKR